MGKLLVTTTLALLLLSAPLVAQDNGKEFDLSATVGRIAERLVHGCRVLVQKVCRKIDKVCQQRVRDPEETIRECEPDWLMHGPEIWRHPYYPRPLRPLPRPIPEKWRRYIEEYQRRLAEAGSAR